MEILRKHLARHFSLDLPLSLKYVGPAYISQTESLTSASAA